MDYYEGSAMMVSIRLFCRQGGKRFVDHEFWQEDHGKRRKAHNQYKVQLCRQGNGRV